MDLYPLPTYTRWLVLPVRTSTGRGAGKISAARVLAEFVGVICWTYPDRNR